MAKTILYITRHGQTHWNVEGRMQGHMDSMLTEEGELQATWLRDALRDVQIDVMHCSTSGRARQTAEIVRGEHSSCEIVYHDGLREIFLGDWEGHLSKDVKQKYAEAYAAFGNTPHLYVAENGGESFYDLRERVVPLVFELVEQNEGKTLLLVSHALTVKTIMGYFEGREMERFWDPPYMHSTALSKIVFEDGKATVELHADVSHYPQVPVVAAD